MRAWYGKGRYWFVLAASASPSPAWGWHGFEARWELLGHEFLNWSENDFADAIDFREVPRDLIESLAEALDGRARVASGFDQASTATLH